MKPDPTWGHAAGTNGEEINGWKVDHRTHFPNYWEKEHIPDFIFHPDELLKIHAVMASVNRARYTTRAPLARDELAIRFLEDGEWRQALAAEEADGLHGPELQHARLLTQHRERQKRRSSKPKSD